MRAGRFYGPTGSHDPGGMLFGAADNKVRSPLVGQSPGTGPLGLREKDVPDGLSKTLFVLERGSRNYAASWAGTGNAGSLDPGGNAQLLGRFNNNPYGNSFWINIDYFSLSSPPPSGAGVNQGKVFSSLHAGGVNALVTDGAVRWIKDTSNGDVLWNLMHRDNATNGVRLHGAGESFDSL
jgi:hypothetical protein